MSKRDEKLRRNLIWLNGIVNANRIGTEKALMGAKNSFGDEFPDIEELEGKDKEIVEDTINHLIKANKYLSELIKYVMEKKKDDEILP